MEKFSEMSGLKQWASLAAGAALVTGALYFTMFKTQRESNATAQQSLEAKLRENAELETYRPKLAEIERQVASLKQQLAIERRIVPDEKELDGPYYSMLNFFDKVGKLERIVNVSALLVSTTKKPGEAKTKHTYQYAPNESVVATCTATTFFSHDLEPPAGASGKPGPVKR